MENANVFKTGSVMDMIQNAEVVEQKADELSQQAAPQQNQQRIIPRKTRTIVREYKKVSRNEKCPCGSGKKYKNCCLHTGKYEQYHELTVIEAADVKNNRIQLSEVSKIAGTVENE